MKSIDILPINLIPSPTRTLLHLLSYSCQPLSLHLNISLLTSKLGNTDSPNTKLFPSNTASTSTTEPTESTSEAWAGFGGDVVGGSLDLAVGGRSGYDGGDGKESNDEGELHDDCLRI
jgi:hypothetical protein